jgi:DNA-binding response OmpR family regulator
MRILIVDDDAQMRQMLGEYLSPSHDVSMLSDGKNAQTLLMAPDHHFDIVLLDIMIPRLKGTALLEQMQLANSKTKVILTSGQTELQRFVGHPNVVGVLEKPFSLDDFSRKLKTYAAA